MIKKHQFLIILFVLIFILISSISIQAEEKGDADLAERMELIEASQRLAKEQTDDSVLDYALFVTDFSGKKEFNLGIKLESNFWKEARTDSKNRWKFLIEAIYLKEAEKIAGFLSLKRRWPLKRFSPYLGLGVGVVEEAEYQLFMGMNLSNSFYIETKYISEDGDLEEGSFYSTAGYQINF